MLLVAAGTAFGGMAVLPAAAAVTPPALVTAAAATTPVEITAPPTANVALMSALSQGLAVANKPAPKPAPPAPPREAARASRDRKAPAAASSSSRYFRPGTGRLTSVYGRRWGRLHAGIDLAAGTGSPIRAATAGTVISAGTESGYGRCVRLLHSDGTVTVYGHMSSLMVSKGERVSGGEQIGREGNTGQSTGPHLHFEVRVNGSPINPLTWLRARGVSI